MQRLSRGEMEHRVDRLRGIKGAEQVHGGCKRTSPTPAARVSRVTR